MALRINGKDMKDAVMKTDQFELRILDFVPDRMRINVKESSGHPFNFVPRFLEVVYPDKTIGVKDTGIVGLGAAAASSDSTRRQRHFLRSWKPLLDRTVGRL